MAHSSLNAPAQSACNAGPDGTVVDAVGELMGDWDATKVQRMIHNLLSADAAIQRQACLAHFAADAVWHDNLFVVHGRENIYNVYRLFLRSGTVRGIHFEEVALQSDVLVASFTLHYSPLLLPFWIMKMPLVCVFDLTPEPGAASKITVQQVYRSYFMYIWSIPVVETFYESMFKPMWGWVASTALGVFMPVIDLLEQLGGRDSQKHDIAAKVHNQYTWDSR